MNKLTDSEKIHFDHELLGIISEADKNLLMLDSIIGFIGVDSPFIEILKISEALNSINIDDAGLTAEDYFRNICEGVKTETRVIQNLNALSLGIRLLKNVGHPSHIMKSINLELTRTDTSISREEEPDAAAASITSPDITSALIEDLDRYINLDISYPALLNAALIHSQFQLIRPFSHGNGLTGRVLFHLNLLWKGKLSMPVLQISKRLNDRKADYQNSLLSLERTGNREIWAKFFISIISESAGETRLQLTRMHRLRQSDYNKMLGCGLTSSSGLLLLEHLFRNPVVSLLTVRERLGINKQSANMLLAKMTKENILTEITGQKRNRLFSYRGYLNILESDFK